MRREARELYYWVNFAAAGIVIHKETCPRVDELYDAHDWEKHISESEALAAAGPTAKKCGLCF